MLSSYHAPRINDKRLRNNMGYGSWTLTYDTAATTHEKWKEAMDFYQEGKLTGIRSMVFYTTIDENGRSDHLAGRNYALELRTITWRTNDAGHEPLEQIPWSGRSGEAATSTPCHTGKGEAITIRGRC